jgi:exopolysaccharide production protein ExoZ
LEIARFIAAFMVASHHTARYAASFGPGWHGFDFPALYPVIFFFTLSGFVILTAHAADFGRLTRIPRYLWRRICRIYPLYLLSLAAPLYFLWRIRSPAYLTQIITLNPFVAHITELNAVAWTLRFEIAFYAAFTLALLPVIGRYLLAGWIILDLAAWLARVTPIPALHLPQMLQRNFFNTQELLFFAGLGAAFLLRRWRPNPVVLWPLLAAAAAAIIVLARLDDAGFHYPPPERVPLAAAAFAAAIFAAAALERAGHLAPSKRLAVFGALSYPLYLFHVVVMFFWSVILAHHPHWTLPPATTYLILLAASLLTAFAAAQFYDRPLQKLLRRVTP